MSKCMLNFSGDTLDDETGVCFENHFKSPEKKLLIRKFIIGSG